MDITFTVIKYLIDMNTIRKILSKDYQNMF